MGRRSIDNIIETIDNKIQGIKEELYEDGYSQSEIEEITGILVEEHKNESSGRKFEERLTELKEIARSERLPEVLILLHATPEEFKTLEDQFVSETGSHGVGHYFGDDLSETYVFYAGKSCSFHHKNIWL